MALETLPDLLVPGLNVVFVGINPSTYSAERGHYFARRSNKFWPCFSRSVLTRPIRAALRVERLEPEHDVLLPRYGIGFTDVVKRPSARADEITPREFATGVELLLEKFARFRPRIACFHGVTGYRYVHRVLGGGNEPVVLGPQELVSGGTRLFVIPNPSGANAHCSRDEQVAWYDRLADEFAAPPANQHPC
jgi:TDG/mug DNA glycosylase family protein